MARQNRRHYRRRPKQNLVWQPTSYMNRVSTPTTVANGQTYSGVLHDVLPGAHKPGDTDHPFLNDHVLERAVGAMSHNGNGVRASSTFSWFSMCIAAVRVPSGFDTPDTIDLFDPQMGEDYCFRMDAVCNANQSQDAIPNWHEVNSKAKRKFEPGDKLAFLWSLISPVSQSQAIVVDISLNLRLLWKLT